MLSFLLLVSSTGRPLAPDAAARCARLPLRNLTFVPTASTTWRSDDGRVLLAAWADDAERWHVGEHGITLATRTPLRLQGTFEAPSGIAFELTKLLAEPEDAAPLHKLFGATTIARLRPDGTGIVGAPPTGGGSVHVADGDGLVAVSDRAGVAATGVGGSRRRDDLGQLVRGALLGEASSYAGVDRLRPGTHLVLHGSAGVKVVEGDRPWDRAGDDDLGRLTAAAVEQVTHLVEQAAARPGDRWLEVGRDPGSLVLAAAVAATGVTGRIRIRPVTPAAAEAARTLAGHLDLELESALALPGGGEAVDARARAATSRVEALVAPTAVGGGLLGRPRDGGGTLLAAVPGGALAPDAGATARRLLTSQAWAAVDASDRAWKAGRGHAVDDDAARAVLSELDQRAPARQRAAADLAGHSLLVDPTAAPAVGHLAVAAAAAGQDPVALLVDALHPPLAGARVRGGEDPSILDERGWRTLAPVLEAHVLGHGRRQLADVLDLDELAMVVRAGTRPDLDTARTLEGALALAVWAGGQDIHEPAAAARTPATGTVEAPATVPTLVTGVTSRSLLELAGLAVPLDSTERDALLGVEVDRDVRDLVHRVLLAAGATPGHLPDQLDRRLSGPDTAHLADQARTLLARRGGTIADPRLALTLPFWRAHVAAPRVVLVAERPPDLAARTSAGLPLRDLLGWWIDAMTSSGASGADVRVVDPGDLAPSDEAEATGWDGLERDGDDAPDLVRVARTVDSLVREVELEAARPLLRTIRRARAAEVAPPTRTEVAPATAPLHVVDELWERAVEADRRIAEAASRADEADARAAELAGELEELRGRRGLRAAWQVLTGGDA